MAQRIKVYLAGPMTGCNPQQRSAWRKRLKLALREAGFQAIDPTDEKARKGAMAVSADIAEAEVVIANMWKESTGTILGIVQAQKLGIPVILIDQHYMNNAVLESLADEIVRDELAAVNILKNKVSKTIHPDIEVLKRTKTGEPKREKLDISKLQRSLKASCAQAGIDDTVFCTLLYRLVRNSVISKASHTNEISSEDIKKCIFDDLTKLSFENVQMAPDDQRIIQRNAIFMRDRWDDYENFLKDNQREKWAKEQELTQEHDRLLIQLDDAYKKIEKLEEHLKDAHNECHDAHHRDAATKYLVTALQTKLNNKRALCVGRIGRSSFQSAFERRGLSREDFERFFIERQLDGRQSNLNEDLKDWLLEYSFVLYAGRDLRHISDPKVGDASNFIRGFAPTDAITRLLDTY